MTDPKRSSGEPNTAAVGIAARHVIAVEVRITGETRRGHVGLLQQVLAAVVGVAHSAGALDDAGQQRVTAVPVLVAFADIEPAVAPKTERLVNLEVEDDVRHGVTPGAACAPDDIVIGARSASS